MKEFKILVVGPVNMDLILKAQKLPSAGEHLFCDTYEYIHGGKGANQAIAAARLGMKATLVSKVGDDPNGCELEAALGAMGIRTEYVSKEENARSGLAVIILESNGQSRILVFPESNMMLKPSEIDKAFLEHYDAMTIQFEIPQDIVIHACRAAAHKNIPFIVDAGPALDFPIEEIKGAEILSPNESETYVMSGVRVVDEQSAKKASILLKERSKAKFIVIKAGEQGAYLYDGVDIKHFVGYTVSAVDPTAAGDAFTAAMTVEYLRTGDIDKSIKFGNAAGALAVTKLGAQPSLPTLKEIHEFIAKRK